MRISSVIFRFVAEYRKPVSAVLEEGICCEESPLFQLRGQIWEEVVQPRVMEELNIYWIKNYEGGMNLWQAARHYLGPGATGVESICANMEDLIRKELQKRPQEEEQRRRGRKRRIPMLPPLPSLPPPPLPPLPP